MMYLRSCTRMSWAARIGAAAILTVGLAASLGLGQASAAPRATRQSGRLLGAPTVTTAALRQSAFDLYAGTSCRSSGTR